MLRQYDIAIVSYTMNEGIEGMREWGQEKYNYYFL